MHADVRSIVLSAVAIMERTSLDTFNSETSSPKSRTSRPMVRAELHGKHQFSTPSGARITIVKRDDKYIARGRQHGHQWGVTLGNSEDAASINLFRILSELEDGKFEPPSQSHRRRLPKGPIPKLTLIELADLFLRDIGKSRGPNLHKTYQARLAHVLRFSEHSKTIKRWRFASDIDREFVVELNMHLMQTVVTRNGKAGSTPKAMSVRMIRLCLETLRTMLNWALRVDVRKLPADFLQPITNDLLGPLPSKDPLRMSPLPLAQRIHLIENMDEWQLRNIAILLVIPARFEDIEGALISDFDFGRQAWRIGTRFGGSDFTKGRTNVVMPLPGILTQILAANASGREDGAMFLKRRSNQGVKSTTKVEIEEAVHRKIINCGDESAATAQGRKALCRQVISNMGAVSTDEIARNLRRLFGNVGLIGVRPYDVRHAVTTDMHGAGLSHLACRYLTLHTANDILNEYTSLDVAQEMSKYFAHIAPLLEAMELRASQLGIREPNSNSSGPEPEPELKEVDAVWAGATVVHTWCTTLYH